MKNTMLFEFLLLDTKKDIQKWIKEEIKKDGYSKSYYDYYNTVYDSIEEYIEQCVYYNWVENNFSCDCNRARAFYDDCDHPCGEDAFDLLFIKRDGIIIYDKEEEDNETNT